MVTRQGFRGHQKSATEAAPEAEVEHLSFTSQTIVMFCFDDILLFAYCDS